jgi:hypothetical protein
MSEEVKNTQKKPKGRPRKVVTKPNETPVVEAIQPLPTPEKKEVVATAEVAQVVIEPVVEEIVEVVVEATPEVADLPSEESATEEQPAKAPMAAENAIRRHARGIQERDRALHALRRGYTVYLDRSGRIVVTNHRDVRNGRNFVERLNRSYTHINSL